MSLIDRLQRRAFQNREEQQEREKRARRPSNILSSLKVRLLGEPTISPEESEPARTDPRTRLRGLRERSLEERNPAQFAEIRRICGLPVREPFTREEFEAFNRKHLLAAVFEKGYRFYPCQAEGLADYLQFGGLLGPIGVGWGKTLLTLAIANHGYRNGKKRIALIVPSSVYPQLTSRDVGYARTHIPFSVPLHYLGGLPPRKRKMLAESGKKGCYLLPASILSRDEGVLRAISPELVIVDEAHYMKNRKAGRTRVLMDYFADRRPQVVALSGTITSKSIRDYHHLAKAALGMRAPVPLPGQMSNEWAQVLDSDAQPSNSQTGPLRPLIDWARDHFPSETFSETVQGFRHAFRARLTSAPGVVATGNSEIGTSLTLANRKVPEGYDQSESFSVLRGLIDQVNEEWLTPNGDEIDHAIHTWKWLFELSAGFYNELVWPEVSAYAQRKGMPEAEAEDLLDRAKEHHSLGQIYTRHLRRFLSVAPLGLHTPMMAGADMAKHGAQNVGTELYGLWRDWKEAEFDGMPERESRAVRVCDFKLQPVVDWAKEVKAGIVWVQNQEIGRWCHEYLTECGIDSLHAPSGEQHNRAILNPENVRRIVVASMSAHGTGKNLQGFQANYFLQWPRSATTAEQVLGRTHRNGQEADELVMRTCHTLEFDALNFAACVNDSLYIHTTTGNRQKLIYADYDPLPVIFPPEALQERGFQNKMLNAEQRTLMDERFNNYNNKKD